MIPLIEAHRGDSANAPENTLAAFDRAIRLGVPWIELDVHPAQDGTLMVIHDGTVNRTTNGSGAVSTLTVAQLRDLDAGANFASEYTGEKIPRLTDVLKLIHDTTTRLNVEIKSSPPGHNVPLRLAEILLRSGRQHDTVVSSFDLQALLLVRAIAPELTLALIGKGPEILAHAEQHHLPWIHVNHKTMTREIVAQAHTHGINVNVWTVDDPATLSFWAAMGVDKLCTNCPARMLSAAQLIEPSRGAEGLPLAQGVHHANHP